MSNFFVKNREFSQNFEIFRNFFRNFCKFFQKKLRFYPKSSVNYMFFTCFYNFFQKFDNLSKLGQRPFTSLSHIKKHWGRSPRHGSSSTYTCTYIFICIHSLCTGCWRSGSGSWGLVSVGLALVVSWVKTYKYKRISIYVYIICIYNMYI